MKGWYNMDDRELRFYIAKIVGAGKEFEAIQLLVNFAKKNQEETSEDLSIARATIKAIKKINKGRNKDIDSLCDDE